MGGDSSESSPGACTARRSAARVESVPSRDTSPLAGRALFALLLVVALWALCCGGAAAEIKLEEGADKATTPHLEMDFGDAAGNVELVEGVKWSPVGGTLGSNLVANSGGGGCGVFEFWGESYPNQDGTGPDPVVAGQRGSWTATSNRTVLIDSASPHDCSGNTPEIPVRTRYTFFDEGPAANTVRMERRISFAPNQERNDVVQGMRFYDPRLPAGTYNQEIFPNEGGTALNTIGDGGPTANGDWNETWMAIDSSTTHAGMVIFHQPDGVHTASVTSDNDGASGSNNSGVTLDRPALGWLEPVTETEYFCFYDATTWPVLTRSPTNLPAGCATPEVPVNVAPPKLSAGAGNPHLGETFQAEPGSWEHATGGFAYQWFRCTGTGSCSEIGGATGTSYTATGADVGHPLKVRVTAMASGGETDYAESNTAGTVSGHVYEGEKAAGHELSGARVQICRLKGSPCRSTTTDAGGFYRLQAPALGDYRVTAFPPAGSNAIARTRTTITHVSAEAESEGQDVILPLPQPPPPSVHFGGSGVRPTNAEGVPVVYWQEPFEISIEAPAGKEVEARIEFPNGLLERLLPCSEEAGGPGIAIFRFCFQPLSPNHGAGRVAIVAMPPRSQGEKEEVEQEEEAEEAEREEEESEPEEPEEEPETPEEEAEHEKETEEEESEEREAEEAEEEGEHEEGEEEETVFPIYIDPSGYVRLPDGSPLADATVKLYAAESADGPFVLVPDGSAAMSPMNRRNPDATDAGGRFGWDVVAGFYKVRAEKSGCNAQGNPSRSFEETGVLTIPPPVENLDLRLECPTTSPPSGSGGSPSPSPRPGPPPRASLRLPPKAKVKVDKLGKYKIKGASASCPAEATGACRVQIQVKALGSSSSSLVAGKTAQLGGKLSKAGLKKLRKAKHLKAKVSVMVTVPNGDPAVSEQSDTFFAPPPKRKR
jgi:hypothetical protein